MQTPLPAKAQYPIALPGLTIFFGPPNSGQKELAKALSDLDPGLAIVDLESPFRCATMELFFGGFDFNLDLSKSDFKFWPNPANITSTADWLKTFRQLLERNLGDDALARIFHADPGQTFIADRTIIRDVDTTANLKTLRDDCDADDCLILHFDPKPGQSSAALKEVLDRSRYIALLSSDPARNLSDLRFTLGDLK